MPASSAGRMQRAREAGAASDEVKVFFSHKWEDDEEGRNTHRRVRKAADWYAERKEEFGIHVVLDENELNGSLNLWMTQKIDECDVILVCITKKYYDVVNANDKSDNCQKEFFYAGKRKPNRMLGVVMERAVPRERDWEGTFAMVMQDDLNHHHETDDGDFDASMRRLADLIRAKAGAPPARIPKAASAGPPIFSLNGYDPSVEGREKALEYAAETRTWTFQEVSKWARQRTWGTVRVSVMLGPPGFGKSVIMAKLCANSGLLGFPEPTQRDSLKQRVSRRMSSAKPWRIGAMHFFRYYDERAKDVMVCLKSVANQLAATVPGLREELTAELFQGAEKLTDPMTLFMQIIAEPCLKIQAPNTRVVVALDALDEADPKHRSALLSIIRQGWQRTPKWLGVLVSSRPEDEVKDELSTFKPLVLKLDDPRNEADVKRFLEATMRPLMRDDQDLRDVLPILTERAAGLFLYARMLQRKLEDIPANSLSRQDALAVSPDGLDAMYKDYFTRLKDALADAGADTASYRALFGALCVARDPLPRRLVADVVGITDQDAVETLLAATSQLLDLDSDTVRFVHKSMPDFLLNRDRAAHKLAVSETSGHAKLAPVLSSLSEDPFALRHAVYHLVKCERHEDAFELLNYFPWIQATISVGDDQEQRRCDIGALLRDCADLGINKAPETDTPRLLSKSLNALSWDPIELASQVLARLRVHEDDQDHPLVKSLREPSEPWLRPVRPTLPHPHDPLQHVLEGHSAEVYSVAVEGDRVVSGSADKTVRIWDAATGALQHVLEGHSDSVTSVAVEGNRVVSGSADKTVRIWDAATGALQHVLEGHSSRVTSVAVEGNRVVSGSADKTVRIWDAATGALEHVLKGHSGYVTSVAVEGDRVVSGSDDDTVRIWDAATGALQHVLEGHSLAVTSVGVEGDRVVSGSDDNTVRIWDAATGALQHVLKGHSGYVTSVAVEGDRVVSRSDDDTVRIWDAATGALQHVLEGHARTVRSVAVEGDRVVSGSDDYTVRIWDAATGALQHVLEGHSNWVTSVAVEGDRVVSGSRDKTVRIWDAATGALQHVLEGHSSWVTSVAVDGDRVVSGSYDNTVRIWDAATGALQHVLEGHSRTIRSVAVKGDRVVSGSDDDTVRIWDAATRALQHVLEGHSRTVRSVAVEGDRVVSGSDDKTVRIWDAATGALQHVLEGHSWAVTSVAVEGDRVVSGSRDKTVRIWDAATGALQHVLEGHYGPVTSVAVEGDRVVSGSYDKTVRIWDAATGALQHVLVGHSDWVNSVAVEGDRVVSGSDDNTVRILEAATGTLQHMMGALQHVLEGHSGVVTSVAVEGDRVVSKDYSSKVRVWNAVTGQALDESELASLQGQNGESRGLPVEVENETHVQLVDGTGFTTDNAVRTGVTARVGDLIVLGDAGGMVHILQVRKGRK